MNKYSQQYKVTAYDEAKGCRADVSIPALSKVAALSLKKNLDEMQFICKRDYKTLIDIKIERVQRYTTDGQYEVFAGKKVIAKSYVGEDGYEVRILQGMPKTETWEKIFNDCPEFAKFNEMEVNIMPKLFSAK